MAVKVPRIRRGGREHAQGPSRLAEEAVQGEPARLIVLGASAVAALVADAVADAFERNLRQASPQLLDRAGLARALGVSTSTVDRLARAGLPCLLVCEAKRFELALVLEWLRNRGEAQS